MKDAFAVMAEACGLQPLSDTEQREYEAFLNHIRDNVVPEIERDVFERERRWTQAKDRVLFIR